jgi:crotonobetainyl-CoA:carnitine CoA-transferase CaiB-like acyl-CoA transferase
VATPLLEGLRVVDLAGEPAAIAGRVLADLGADVVLVEPPEGVPLRAVPHAFAAWAAGKRSVVVDGPDDPRLDALLAGAHVVIDTPGFPGAWTVDPSRAPEAVWVSVTPFGLDGPRATWRASDLGIMAASGNMWATGDPDRPPVRCTMPSGYAHAGGEVAFAALSALWAGGRRRVDVALQEVVFVANMSALSDYAVNGSRGQRAGANIGRTREIWPTKDGYVSYGVRAGAARVKNWAHLAAQLQAEGIPGAEVLSEIDWTTYNPANASDDELEAIQEPLGQWFSRHTNQELYELACEHNLFLAPAMSPREMFVNEQLHARGFFASLGGYTKFPHRFVVATSVDGEVAPATAAGPAPELGSGRPTWSARGPSTSGHTVTTTRVGNGAWSGVNILEFGSGAAGPISTRYFVEHGATVLRIESASRPDFLRVMALGPKNPHGLEGSSLYDVLNVGKRNATFNLKDPRAVDLVKRLMLEWADAVVENFAPRAMRGFGLDYESLAPAKPSLVMISACLNGQTGPHKDYPGFGSQGSALSGFTFLTGWPDREPVGPFGTITDSLAPRYVAAAVAAGLHYRRRTGRGVYLDLSQVESGIYTLSPWLLEADAEGHIVERAGNRSRRAVPHGAFPCADETAADGTPLPDRWVAIACWTDEEWAVLAEIVGIDDVSLAHFDARRSRIDEVEAKVAAWTSGRTRIEVAETLQAAGIEAVPVLDFGDIHADPQVAHRRHFVRLTHPFMGPRVYEHNGFRISGLDVGYDRSGPTLGQDNDWVQRELLGLDDEERAKLAADGVFT